MQRCLDLARKGFGKVAPNPMVGCVIVKDGKIISEGYHQQYGTAHAEVNAIHGIQGKDAKDMILYVNLEPCSHFGKTPPCADLIIKTGFKYVIIGTLDPNPLVAGKGIQRLVSAGIDVKIGVLEKECRELNRRFFTFFETKRPYIVLKWAETEDKYIGASPKSQAPSPKSQGKGQIQISGTASQKLVHQWRAEEQGILVGTKTALNDNPQLTVRKAKGKNPVRIVIDRLLKVPASYHLLDGKVPTIIFTTKKKAARKNVEYVVIDFENGLLSQIMTALYERNIQSVIVEGGSKLLTACIQNGLWDEARIFTAPKTLAQIAGKKVVGVDSPMIRGRVSEKLKVGTDRLVVLNRIS